MLKIMGKAQVSGRNYGQKIISILNGILSIKASNKTCRNADDGELDRKCKRCQYNEYYEAK